MGKLNRHHPSDGTGGRHPCWGVPQRMDETGTRSGGRNWNQYSHGPVLMWIQMHRENIRAATPDECYCQIITIPLLDHLLMANRFNEYARKDTMGLHALYHQWWARLMTGAITLTAWLSCSKKICPQHCHYLRSSTCGQ